MHEVITNNLDLWISAMLNKTNGGRGSNGKPEAYGIKKLRELVLDLAMHGKLVQQDPDDEPAPVLLEKLAKEKARLINEGVVSKERSLSEVTDEEEPYEAPQGWRWVRFGNIARHNSGKTLDRGRNTGQLRDYITTSNLYWGRFDLDSIRQMPIEDDELEKCTALKGDLLICEGGEAGRAAVWPHDHAVCFQNHIHRARFFGGIDPYYVYRFLEKLNTTGEIDQHRKGMGISNMSSKALASIAVPLPPLAEQHRIVATVDQLMALCDQLEQQQIYSLGAHQTLVGALLGTLTRLASHQELTEAWTRIASRFDILFTTEHGIDKLKQAILQLAVAGKLVPQDPNDEPASVLLERIRREKQRLGKEALRQEAQATAIGEYEEPFGLPVGWAWLRFGEMGEVIGGGTPSKANPRYWGGRIPWVSPKDMKADFISESIDTISEEAVEGSAVKLIPAGSLLIVVRGMILAHSFPVAITRVNVTVNQDMKAIVFHGLDKDYVLLMLKALRNDFVAMVDRSTHGTCKLVSRKLWAKALPIPPFAEQKRIVAKVEELMAACDALKGGIANAQTTRIYLADAIVEQAIA